MRSDDNKDANMETVRLAALYAERGRGVVAADLAVQKDFMQQIHLQMYSGMQCRKECHLLFTREAAGAESVECALNFQAVRIGHGVRCTENLLVMRSLQTKELRWNYVRQAI